MKLLMQTDVIRFLIVKKFLTVVKVYFCIIVKDVITVFAV